MLNAITCATQGGVNKIPRLLDLTSRWRGRVSFSTVISSESDLDLLFQFWADYPLLQEYVSVHILMELPQVQRPQNGRYPINELRNLALHNVKTDYVFLNDVDFIPSDYAHDEIATLISASPPSTKTFWVLPAFERITPAITSNTTNAKDEVTDVAMIPKTKPELMKAIYQDKVVTTFHPYFPPGHKPTNFLKWYTYRPTSTMKYPINYAKWFEPYVVCKTQDLHQFFPLFRGFGFNKNSFFVEANLRNFTYYVLSHQFIVHMNHKGREDRFEQDNSHLGPMMSAFLKYLKNTYQVSNEYNEFY
jgi:glycosyltransferase-like protein LARGE